MFKVAFTVWINKTKEKSKYQQYNTNIVVL